MEQDLNRLNNTPSVTSPVANTPSPVVQLATPTYQQETTAPVVTEIDASPVFKAHSKKLLLIFAGIITLCLIGVGTMSYLRTKRQSSSTPVNTATTGKPQNSTNTGSDGATGTSGQGNNSQTPPSSQATPSIGISNGSNNSGSTTQTVYCGVSGMPEGACIAIKSVEKDGLKNNPYVAADTSQVPEGSTVQVEESSWKVSSSEAGSVNFTAVLGGKPYKGVSNLKIVNGVWKVVSYTLS